MDNLEIRASESFLRFHDACFDRCVQSLGSPKLDSVEAACITNCFKSYGLTFKNGFDTFSKHQSSVAA